MEITNTLPALNIAKTITGANTGLFKPLAGNSLNSGLLANSQLSLLIAPNSTIPGFLRPEALSKLLTGMLKEVLGVLSFAPSEQTGMAAKFPELIIKHNDSVHELLRSMVSGGEIERSVSIANNLSTTIFPAILRVANNGINELTRALGIERSSGLVDNIAADFATDSATKAPLLLNLTNIKESKLPNYEAMKNIRQEKLAAREVPYEESSKKPTKKQNKQLPVQNQKQSLMAKVIGFIKDILS